MKRARAAFLPPRRPTAQPGPCSSGLPLPQSTNASMHPTRLVFTILAAVFALVGHAVAAPVPPSVPQSRADMPLPLRVVRETPKANVGRAPYAPLYGR